MFKKIKAWLKRHIDYEIVGEYYNTDGNGHYYKSIPRNIILKSKRRLKLWN